MPNLTVSSAVDAFMQAADKPAMQTAVGVREVLTANRTYFVRTDGNDSNTGLTNTAGGAFLTIQKAVDTIAALDISIYTATVKVGAGTYSETVTLKRPLGAGNCILEGDPSTPTNCVIAGVTDGIAFSQPGEWFVNGFRITAAGTPPLGSAVYAGQNAIISLSNINFGACPFSHVYADGGFIRFLTNYAVSGGSATGAHWQAHLMGKVRASGLTVTITNTPNFTAGWAWTDRGMGFIEAFSMTFIGSATGARFNIGRNSVLFVNTTNASYLPGNSAGINDGTATYS